jgi:hypothetical protein
MVTPCLSISPLIRILANARESARPLRRRSPCSRADYIIHDAWNPVNICPAIRQDGNRPQRAGAQTPSVRCLRRIAPQHGRLSADLPQRAYYAVLAAPLLGRRPTKALIPLQRRKGRQGQLSLAPRFRTGDQRRRGTLPAPTPPIVTPHTDPIQM